MSPIVRVLAFRALAATSERVMPARKELLVGRRAALGADEVPPACPLVLPEPALRARGEDLPDARPEEGQIVRREIRDRLEHQENVAQQERPASPGVSGKTDGATNIGLRILREADARRRREMVGRLSSVEGRRPAHRVDDVLVETREEPKSMLAGQPVLDRARRRRWRADVRSCPRRHRRRECCAPSLPRDRRARARRPRSRARPVRARRSCRRRRRPARRP